MFFYDITGIAAQINENQPVGSCEATRFATFVNKKPLHKTIYEMGK